MFCCSSKIFSCAHGFKVMAAFIATAWITCLVAGINAYCMLTRKLDKYLSTLGSCNRPENFERLVWTIVPFEVPKYFAEGWPVLAWCFHCLFIFCRTIVAWILHLFDSNMVVTEIAVKNALDILCDVQVVTGTAIMIAGSIQKESLTFYHQQIVISYWFLTLNSFWLARAGIINESDEEDAWHYWTRLVVIFATSILSIYYQLATLPRQNDEWDSYTRGFCFIYHDKSGYNQIFLWLAGLILFAAYTFCELLAGLMAKLSSLVAGATSRNPNLMDQFSGFMDGLEKKWHKKYQSWVESQLYIPLPESLELVPRPVARHASYADGIFAPSDYSIPTREQRFKTKFLRWPVKGILNFPLLIEWCFLRFFALVAWGDDHSIAVILSLFGFTAWNSYNLIDLKLSNSDLATDESGWGFGQVLPLALLGLILLNIMDSVQSKLPKILIWILRNMLIFEQKL
jgi:hypothetical protein